MWYCARITYCVTWYGNTSWTKCRCTWCAVIKVPETCVCWGALSMINENFVPSRTYIGSSCVHITTFPESLRGSIESDLAKFRLLDTTGTLLSTLNILLKRWGMSAEQNQQSVLLDKDHWFWVRFTKTGGLTGKLFLQQFWLIFSHSVAQFL